MRGRIDRRGAGGNQVVWLYANGRLDPFASSLRTRAAALFPTLLNGSQASETVDPDSALS